MPINILTLNCVGGMNGIAACGMAATWASVSVPSSSLLRPPTPQSPEYASPTERPIHCYIVIGFVDGEYGNTILFF